MHSVFFVELAVTSQESQQPYEPSPESSDLVPVVFAADRVEAEFYQALLADADIQANIDTDEGQQITVSARALPCWFPSSCSTTLPI